MLKSQFFNQLFIDFPFPLCESPSVFPLALLMFSPFFPPPFVSYPCSPIKTIKTKCSVWLALLRYSYASSFPLGEINQWNQLLQCLVALKSWTLLGHDGTPLKTTKDPFQKAKKAPNQQNWKNLFKNWSGSSPEDHISLYGPLRYQVELWLCHSGENHTNMLHLMYECIGMLESGTMSSVVVYHISHHNKALYLFICQNEVEIKDTSEDWLFCTQYMKGHLIKRNSMSAGKYQRVTRKRWAC